MTSDFMKYGNAGFLDDLLPIIPPDANLDPNGSSYKNLLASRGKVPGTLTAKGQWVGREKWTERSATFFDLRKWQSWSAGIGMQGRSYPAVDIDVSDPDLAEKIQHLAFEALGAAPIRFGNGSRRVLVYRCEGLRKQRLEFLLPRTSDTTDPKASCTANPKMAVELLGVGQQYVVEGIHPRTNSPYRWYGQSPADLGPAGLTEITPSQADEFFDRLAALLKELGCTSVAKTAARVTAGSAVQQIALLAPSVDHIARALAAVPNEVDYDTWIKVGMAIKASAGPEHADAGFALWDDWSAQWPNDPEEVLTKWEGFKPPFKVGWTFLARFATEYGDGSFNAAAEDFEAIEGAVETLSPRAAMFARYVYVASLNRVIDLETGTVIGREPFNVINRRIGAPSSARDCAWNVLTSSPDRLQAVDGITFRPGGPRLIYEDMPGLKGWCVNTWIDERGTLPDRADATEVAPWLDLVAFVIPDAAERETVLNWLAWVVQNPSEKPNWALVIGSTYEGIGKDTMLAPVRDAIGRSSVREITADDLASDFTDYLVGARLLIVNEMELNERRAMANRLKPMVASPPYTLRVNIKHQPQYQVPNLIAAIFFTNMENALAVSDTDRRYFVTWNPRPAMPQDAYRAIHEWYEAGGRAKAARWLLDRELGDFNAKGRAPETLAKRAMGLAARPGVEIAIHEGLDERVGPFSRRLFGLNEVFDWIKPWCPYGKAPHPKKLAGLLRKAGALQFEGRCRLGPPPIDCVAPALHDPKQTQLFAMPGDEAALEMDRAAIREAFWSERQFEISDFDAEGVVK
jgi:hypothetical protein